MKFEDEKAFGELISQNIHEGDLVSWNNWFTSDGFLIKKMNYGTVLSKEKKEIGNRPVVVVKVFCSKTGKILDLDPFKLQIEGTNYNHEDSKNI